MFKQNMQKGYYLTKVVDSYNESNMNFVNYNTKINERNPVINGKLSLNHLEFIEFFVRLIKPKNFLELGVQFGENINNIIHLIPEQYYGVDLCTNENIDFLIKNKNLIFFNQSTDDFFKELDEKNINLKLDMAFIDACHTHDASYKDFLNIRKHMNEDGFIFFHDCYPASEFWTDKGLCGDCYKTSEVIRLHHNNEFEILTIPVNPGISIARKCSKQLSWL